MKFNFFQICQNLIKDLSFRQKEIISRRFALQSLSSDQGGIKGETLESIGKDFGITRERVRQIEKDGFLGLKPKTKQCQKIFQYFQKHLESRGGLQKEDTLLTALAGEKQRPQVRFLLTLAENFQRLGETEDFYPLWTINQDSLKRAKEILDSLFQGLLKSGKSLTLKELSSFSSLKEPACPVGSRKLSCGVLTSYLEISKKIQQNSEGLFGLKDWPEINPRGVKDKAYLVFKKNNKPLHFTEVANLITGSLVQTVHNELIKDPRFVLVGRGVYALQEWGYFPGQVKDVISKILEEERKPLDKEEILEKVLKQRLVKENTVFLNLSNKKYFLRNSQGKYEINAA